MPRHQLNFAGFVANVETFQVTADGNAGANFDLSSSQITGNTLINTNSTVDVAFLFANMLQDDPATPAVDESDPDGDGRPEINVDILNPTDNAGTRVDQRDSDVTGSNDEINLTVTSSDDDDNDSGPIVLDEGLEHLDLSTAGSPVGSTVAIDSIVTNPGVETDAASPPPQLLNTQGIHTVNIDTAVTLTVGDTDGAQNVNFLGAPIVDTPQTVAPGADPTGGTTPDPFNPIEGGQNDSSDPAVTGSKDVLPYTGTGLSGFENSFGTDTGTPFGLTPEAPRVSTINGSSSTGSINLSTFGSTNGVTIDGGSNNDRLQGSNSASDLIRGNAGHDIIDGGTGSGSVDGNDTLLGGLGNDSIFGNGGNDEIHGGEGHDQIVGGDGNDMLFGDGGDDIIDMSNVALGTVDGVDYVEGGLGDDIIIADAATLVGRADGNDPLTFVDQVNGGDDTDSLFILGSQAGPGNSFGLNDVQQVENFIFQDGAAGGMVTQTYDLGVGASPATTIVSTYNADTGGDIVFDGSDDNVELTIDASPFTRGATFIGSDQDNTFTGGSGDDTFLPDSDFTLTASSTDEIIAGGGNDDILVGAGQLVTGGGLSIDGGTGTDRIIVQSGHRGPNAAIDGNYTGIEELVVEDTDNVGGTDFDLSIDGGFTNGGQTLTVDGTGMDEFEDLGVDARTAAAATTLDLLGGEGDDFFDMGQNLDGDVSIDGGGDNLSVDLATLGSGGGGIGVSNGDQVQVNFDGITILDSAFNNVSNTEVVKIESDGLPGVGTLNLGAAAVAAGIEIVDASALDAAGYNGSTIDASGFTNDITIIDGDANLNIITDANDTVVLAGGDDTVMTGLGDDKLLISGTDLDSDDTVDMGETQELPTDDGDQVIMQNMQGAVNAVVDLDTQSGFETFLLEGTGNRTVGTDADAHTLTFQDGNVGTVTDITIDGSASTDSLDSLTVRLAGTNDSFVDPNGNQALPAATGDVDSDFSFFITGTSGDDTLIKGNVGNNNKIDANFGDGADTVRATGQDLGDMSLDGGTQGEGNAVDQIVNGPMIDDDFINLLNFDILTSSGLSGGPGALDAILGREADEAGFSEVVGSAQDDVVTIDPAFDNALTVNLAQGGNDKFDAGASSSTVNFVFDNGLADVNGIAGDVTTLDANDTLIGGTGTDDTLALDFDANGQAVDLNGMSGVETVNVTESNGTVNVPGDTYTIVTGNVDTDNLDNLFTINQTGFEGETLIVDASAHTGNLIFNGEAASGFDSVISGSGDDTLNGGGRDDTLTSGAGEDEVNGGHRQRPDRLRRGQRHRDRRRG